MTRSSKLGRQAPRAKGQEELTLAEREFAKQVRKGESLSYAERIVKPAKPVTLPVVKFGQQSQD